MTDDDHHRLWKLVEFVKRTGGHMLDARNPMAVRFVVPDAAIDGLNEVLEASQYIVTSTFEPNIFQRGYIVSSIEHSDEPVAPAISPEQQSDPEVDEIQRLLDQLEALVTGR
jgi:hypothetical protein